jgi:sugar phosphate isomerase/epimerase
MVSKISLNPVTITPCNYEESLNIASKAGYYGIGLRFNLIRDYLNSGHTLAEAKNILKSSKLQATEMGFLSGWMFHGGIPLAGKRGRTGETDQQLIEEMEFLFLVTKELGSPPITALVELNETGPIQKAIEDFSWLCDHADKHGLKIMLEFSGSAPQVNRTKVAWELIKESRKKNAGILLDSFLMFMNDLYLEDLEFLPTDRIFTVHISDAKAKPKNELNMLKDRLIPGEGVIPLESFIKEIKRKGYDGYYTVEIFNEDYQKKDPLEIAIRSRIAVEKLLAT